jgi:hypothetical protein
MIDSFFGYDGSASPHDYAYRYIKAELLSFMIDSSGEINSAISVWGLSPHLVWQWKDNQSMKGFIDTKL